jgi:L-ascorbate metabolism protein UlaG (beta-lactamase superfamily)
MTTIRRLADSCLTVTTDQGTTLFDPGFFTFDHSGIDLTTIGDVQRVLITHEHGDHVKPEFVRWLVDRGDDVAVYGNSNVAGILVEHDIEVRTGAPDGVSAEECAHGTLPNGSTVPNTAWTIDAVFTHPGDSHEPSMAAPVLALPLIVPWASMRGSMEFAMRVKPQQVVPIHDFYLSELGRNFLYGMADGVLGNAGIEFITLNWGESATV